MDRLTFARSETILWDSLQIQGSVMTIFKAREMSKRDLTQLIKDKALELGYADVGITSVDVFEGFREEMEKRPGYDYWLGLSNGSYVGAHPKEVMGEAQSIISVIYDFSDIDFPENLVKSVGRA